MAFDLSAQISGTVTINQGAATAGTNYQTFTDLATALNTSGISGPLTVNVVANSGPYAEQFIFNQISGANAFNRIVINGNNNLVTWNGINAAQPSIIGMNGADYFTFNNLNVQGTGTYAYCAMLYSGANFNVFSACTFSVPFNSTSSLQIPVVFSGSGTSYATAGNSGNGNTFDGCTMYSGYAGIWMYGLNAAPFTADNTIQNCNISDFYYCGVYSYYTSRLTMRNNILERLTRTLFTTTYGSFFIYNSGLMCDGNQYRRLFNANITAANSCYPIYGYYSQGLYNPEINTIRNNMVYDIQSNGTIYGILYYYLNGNIYNNTVSLDDANASSGTTYGIYTYGTVGYPVDLKNNMISVTRGGTGSKLGLYIPTAGNITSDRNNIYVASAAGVTNTAYYTPSFFPSLAAYQSATSLDATSYSLDPVFSSITNSLYPTTVALNNQAIPLGIVYDASLAIRSQIAPDIGALEFLTPNCSGTPSLTAISQPSYQICFGEDVPLGLTSLSSSVGLTYQWNVSTVSALGPWTPIPNANTPLYTAPDVFANSFYQVVQTCTLPGGGSMNAVSTVTIASTTTANIPYYENFDGIGRNGRLPNCSWSSPSPKTYTSSMYGARYAYSGTAYACFEPVDGPNYYYTNGIYLYSGVIYSTSCRYRSEFSGLVNNGWSPLSILLSNTQSVIPTTTLATTNGSVTAGPYAILSNTFTVGASGLYYVAVQASPIALNAPFITIDDLSVTAPCVLGNNTPSLNPGTFTSFTLCTGQTKTLSVSGASSYSWNIGGGNSATSIYTGSIVGTNFLSVTGTNTLTGCSAVINRTATVYNVPSINISSMSNSVCQGSSLQLTAFGASTYTWGSGQTSANLIISPTVASSYSVSGTSSLGCSSTASMSISILSTPTITLSSPSNFSACLGQGMSVNAAGANTYTWNQLTTGSVFSYSPVVPGTQSLTVVGTNTTTGCLSQQVLRPLTVYSLPVISITGTNAVCSGSSVNLNANGAATYTWLNTGTNLVSLSVSPTSNTTYSLVGASAEGCLGNIASQLITINALPNISITGTNAVCSGNSVLLMANGAVTYTWLSSGSNASTLNPAPAINTTYSLVGMSALGCIGNTATQAVAVYSLPAISVSGTNAVCSGNTLTLTANGAASYTWINTGSNSANLTTTPISNMTYSLIGTSAQGCAGNLATRAISVYSVPVIAISGTNALCSGNALALTANGAASYTWINTGSNGSVFTASPTSNITYSLIGTSAQGCTGNSATQLVTVYALPAVSITGTNAICLGNSSLLNANGALSYTWMNTGSNSANLTASPTSNTTYSLLGMSALGCIGSTATLAVSVYSLPSVVINGANTVCIGNALVLSASGANTYTWLAPWGNGATVNVAPASNTTYSVIGTSAQGCIGNIGSQAVSVYSVPVIAISGTNALCSGNTITLSASGAATYTWINTGSNGSVFTASPTSNITYSLIGTSAQGCTGNSATQLVTVYALPAVSITGTNAICLGNSSLLNANGALSYTWMNTGSNSANLTASPTSNTTYSLLGMSALGCIGSTATLAVSVYSLPSVVINGANTVCIGNALVLSASGANTYTWLAPWGNGATVNVAPASNTTYSVIGTSAQGCIGNIGSQAVSVYSVPVIAISGTNALCSGNTITLSASGAATYTWINTGSNGSVLTASPTSNTTYSALGASSQGCTSNQATQLMTVYSLPAISLSASSTTVCALSTVTLTANGASTYSWSNNTVGNTTTVSPASTSTFSVAGLNLNGCSASSSISISTNSLPVVSISPSALTLCAMSDASLTAMGAASYSWSTGSIGAAVVITPSVTSSYTVTGTNGFGCNNSSIVVLTTNTLPVIAITADNPTVCANSVVSMTASGGSTYSWSTGSVGAIISVTPAITTSYSVQGTDPLTSCIGKKTITITAAPLPSLSVLALSGSSSSPTICIGEAASYTASGANSYSWMPGNTVGSTFTVAPATGSTYTVLGSGANACTGSTTVSVVVAACNDIKEMSRAERHVRVYPNPSSGRIFMDFDFEGEKQIQVLSLLGSLVLEIKTSDMHESFDLSSYAKGLYYVRIKSASGWSNHSIVTD